MINEYISLKALSVTAIILLYSLSSFIQRQHLFVWSVFAPKLIYNLAYLFVEISLNLFLLFLDRLI